MNWLRFRYGYYLFSGLLIIIGLTGILKGGLQPALEFTGGSELVVETTSDPTQVEQAISSQVEVEEDLELSEYRWDNNRLTISLSQMSDEQKNAFLNAVNSQLNQPLIEIRFQTIGPAMSQELILKTAYAIALGVVSILIYLWWQFKDWRFGLAGVLAMLHDSVILLGSFAWFGLFFEMKVDLLFVTALLTTLSFSVHDTIVNFDQIREIGRQSRRDWPLWAQINQAVTQTLPRSLNNSFTIIFMLAALLLLGGNSLQAFTLALLVGTITGTFSSTFTAVPLYFDLQKRRK